MTVRSLLDPPAAAEVADAMLAAGFTTDGVQAAYGPAIAATITATDAAAIAARRPVREDNSPLGVITRLMLLGESLPESALRDILPAAVEPLLEVGSDRVTVPWEIRPYGDETHDWYAVFDRSDSQGRPLRSDHVLGIGGAATTLAQTTIRRPVQRALDVGTGCGIQALHLTTHAASVTGTDILPRALQLAATSAALSRVDIELLEGDLTEPIADREFDLVVCNPPFVLGPADRFVYRDVAAEGDAFCRRAVRSCANVLADGGVAQLLANWLHVDGEDWRDRVASWVNDLGCDAWLIERDLQDPLDYVRTWADDAGEGDDNELAEQWLRWFRDRRVDSIGFGWVILRRGESPHRVAVEQVLHPVDQPLGDAIAGWLDRSEWLRSNPSDSDLLRHRFSSAETVRLDASSKSTPEGWEQVAAALVMDAGFRWSIPTDELTAALVAGCDGTRPLGAIATVLQLATPGSDQAEIAAAACNAVRGLVDRGVLLP